MKKQRFFMLGIITVLVAVLSLTFVSSTFAKYTSSGKAEDTARVAKWGVNVAVSGDDAFNAAYDDKASVEASTVVAHGSTVVDGKVTGDKVLAPGTAGTLGSVEISGTPEVDVKRTVSLELTLTNWKDADGKFYCPIVFTIKVSGQEEVKVEGIKYNSASDLETAVESKVNALSKDKFDANADVACQVTIHWAWAIQTGADDTAKLANDVKDTHLGDEAAKGAAATIAAKWSATVEQID